MIVGWALVVQSVGWYRCVALGARLTVMTPGAWWQEGADGQRPLSAAVRDRGPLSAREIVLAAAPCLREAVVVKDSGCHKYWITRSAPCLVPERSLASCHFGAMGFALPAAIGASIGVPDRPVIAMCGDGGMMMELSDVTTATLQKCANLKIVVFNNAGLGPPRAYEHAEVRDTARCQPWRSTAPRSSEERAPVPVFVTSGLS